MFSQVAGLLERFHSKPIQFVALIALGMLVSGVVLANLVRWLRQRRQDGPEGWPSLMTRSAGAVLKTLAGLAVVTAICLHLRSQGQEFAFQRGGVTQRNYDAVRTIWGQPHVQRELSVRLGTYTTHYYDKDGLELDGEKLRATSMPVGFRKSEVEEVLPVDPVLEAEHDLSVTMNYRRKGSAWYPGFEADGVFRYKVANVSDKAASANFSFPLPAGQGLVANLKVTVDGADLSEKMEIKDGSLTWRQEFPAGRQANVAVSYHTRGLESIRLEPGAGRQLRHYVVRMLLKDVRPEQHSNPIGCMAPTSIEPAPDGTLLTWRLDNAVTRLGLGTILPQRTQEGYYVGQILAAAPWGLVLLLAMMVLTYLATGRTVQWVPLAVVSVAFDLAYVLMGYLADGPMGLAGGLAISAAALTAVVAILEFAWAERLVAWATVSLFLLFVAGYPLLQVTDHEGLLLTCLHVALLAYVVVLLIRQARIGPTGT